MIDATIVQAPSSTKNKSRKRDPEMRSTRKNNQFYFGMKIHIGSDINSNVIHSATVTSANVADIDEMPKLLREEDEVVFSDAGYSSDSYKRGAHDLGITWKVNAKCLPSHTKKKRINLSNQQKKNNSSVRARIEHCFRVIKMSIWLSQDRL